MTTPEIGVENLSTKLAIKDLAFWVEACNLQLKRDVAPAWGKEPWAVALYAANQVPAGAYPLALKDEVPAGEEGDHGSWDGIIAGSVLVDGGASITLSHETVEMYGDPYVDMYIEDVAVELCDPVEAQSYFIDVEIFAEKRRVEVSNWVTPAYFDSKSSGPWDFLGLLSGPLTIAPGGYLITKSGNRFARGASCASLRDFARKLGNPNSRLHRRMLKLHA